MAEAHQRAVGRGERVLPGVWRLRLPLPWPGVPHCNAWAIAAGDGVVLVDTGVHEPGSIGHLERALEQVGLRVEHVRLVVCTHAHSDHCGQAPTIAERAGCEVWMHPRSDHLFTPAADPEAVARARLEVARQSGVPEEPLRALRRERRRGRARSWPATLTLDRDLVPGVEIETDLGTWQVHRDAGARALARLPAPARAAAADLRRPPARPRLAVLRRRLDARPGRASSCARSTSVEALDARLALSGHGRPFTDVHGHIDANRALVAAAARRGCAARSREGAAPAFEVAPARVRRRVRRSDRRWLLTETLALPDAPRAPRRGVAHAARATRRRWARLID